MGQSVLSDSILHRDMPLGLEIPKDTCFVRRYDPNSKSEVERKKSADIIGHLFTYERVSHDSRPMTFLADGTIGLGEAGRERFWNVRQEDDRLVLDIASETEITCSLVLNELSEWTGRWLHAEQMPIVLRYKRPIYLEASADSTADTGASIIPVSGPAVKLANGGIFTRDYRLRAFSQECSDFTSVSDSNVLIYFRHGFGDWVTFSYILPLLNQSNRYWITRYGDDYTSVMEHSRFITPIYLGSNTIMCDDGGLHFNKNMGIDLNGLDGSSKTVNLPLSLHDACVANGIDVLLHVSFSGGPRSQ